MPFCSACPSSVGDIWINVLIDLDHRPSLVHNFFNRFNCLATKVNLHSTVPLRPTGRPYTQFFLAKPQSIDFMGPPETSGGFAGLHGNPRFVQCHLQITCIEGPAPSPYSESAAIDSASGCVDPGRDIPIHVLHCPDIKHVSGCHDQGQDTLKHHQ